VDPNLPFHQLGRYRIQRALGSGGMGTVYRAWDPQLERAIAIKVVKPEFTDQAMRLRLVKEAQALAKLSHQNVCHVYDVGTEGDTVWVAMELVDGTSLRPWSEQHPLPELVRVLRDAAEGLHAAHAANIVHRDVKPENVLVASDGRAVVTDFGLARTETVDAVAPTISGDIGLRSTASSTSNHTQSGIVAGTPAYLAPEQLTGSPLDARVDQFAWGVMAWELITGIRPFPIVASERLVAIRNGITPPPSMSPALAGVLAKAMSAAPRDRFTSMRLLIDAFAQATAAPSAPPHATPPSPSGLVTDQHQPAPASRSWGPIFAGFAIVVGLLVVGFTALWTRDHKTTTAQPSHAAAPAQTPQPGPSSAADLISQAIGSNVPVDDTAPPPGAAPTPPAPPVAANNPDDYRSWGVRAINRKISENVFAEMCSMYADPKSSKSRTGLSNDLDWGPVVRRSVVHGRQMDQDATALMYEVKGQRRSYQFDGSDDEPGRGLMDVPVGTIVAICAEQETKSFIPDDRSWDSMVLMETYLPIANAPAIAAFTKDAPYHVSSTKLHAAQNNDEIDTDLKGAVLVRTKLTSVDGHRWMTDDTWAVDIPESLPNADKLRANTMVWLVMKDLHTQDYTGADKKDHDKLLLVGTAKAVILDMFPAP
jgi:serine/threonine protein kinase